MIRSSNSMFYIGARSCECLPEDDKYYGSCDSFIEWQKDNADEVLEKHITGVFPSRALAIEHEIELHDFYDVAKNPLFWNKAKQTAVGFDTAGTKLSKEHIEKVMKYVRGIPQSEEHKRKRAAAITGRIISEEQKAKQSAKMKGRKLSADHIEQIVANLTGRKHSEETKEKMRLKSFGRKMSDDAKEKMRSARVGNIACFDIIDKKFVRVSKDNYYSNKDRYRTNNSLEVKSILSTMKENNE